jgi:hypothetical protein
MFATKLLHLQMGGGGVLRQVVGRAFAKHPVGSGPIKPKGKDNPKPFLPIVRAGDLLYSIGRRFLPYPRRCAIPLDGSSQRRREHHHNYLQPQATDKENSNESYCLSKLQNASFAKVGWNLSELPGNHPTKKSIPKSIELLKEKNILPLVGRCTNRW